MDSYSTYYRCNIHVEYPERRLYNPCLKNVSDILLRRALPFSITTIVATGQSTRRSKLQCSRSVKRSAFFLLAS